MILSAKNSVHYFGVVLFLLFTCGNVYSQAQLQQHIGSVLLELSHAKQDTGKVILLNNLSFAYNEISPDSGIIYGKQALQLATNLNWKKGMAIANSNLGINYRSKSDFPDALDCDFKALEFNKELGDKQGIASNLENIGSVYENRGDNAKALANYLDALKINQETSNQKGIAINMVTLGNLYEQKNDYAKAREYLLGALRINEQINDKKGTANVLSNIGTLLTSRHEFAAALGYDYNALHIEEQLGNKIGIAVNEGNIGEIYCYIATAKDAPRPDSLVARGRTENFNKGIEYLKKSIYVCNSIGFLKGKIKFNKTLANAYRAVGKNAEALQSFILYADAKDSVFSAESNIKLKQIEINHDKELKNKDIEILKYRQGYEQEKKREERGYFIAGISALLLILFFIVRERKKSEQLLLNILPAKIAERLKQKEHPIADHFGSVSILFIDMAGFTKYTENRNPKEIVSTLNDVFTHFDSLADKHGLEKIKTIGDCYMAVSGLPEPREDHAAAAVAMAIDIRQTMKGYKAKDDTPIHFRMGLDCGAVVAGVIGKKKFIYDIWGDAVNTASRMESTGKEGEIHCTDNFKKELEKNPFEKGKNVLFTSRGLIEVKSKGHMHTWFIE